MTKRRHFADRGRNDIKITEHGKCEQRLFCSTSGCKGVLLMDLFTRMTKLEEHETAASNGGHFLNGSVTKGWSSTIAFGKQLFNMYVLARPWSLAGTCLPDHGPH